jgi:hypothetical protein
MAAKDNPLPYSFQNGRLNDFIQGMHEASDAKAKALLEGIAVGFGVKAITRRRR